MSNKINTLLNMNSPRHNTVKTSNDPKITKVEKILTSFKDKLKVKNNNEKNEEILREEFFEKIKLEDYETEEMPRDSIPEKLIIFEELNKNEIKNFSSSQNSNSNLFGIKLKKTLNAQKLEPFLKKNCNLSKKKIEITKILENRNSILIKNKNELNYCTLNEELNKKKKKKKDENLNEKKCILKLLINRNKNIIIKN